MLWISVSKNEKKRVLLKPCENKYKLRIISNRYQKKKKNQAITENQL